ncbi:MAG: tripartite tricarboxylate transporter TctB family protein [Alphaproteobacteria bacterium]|nr:tripartite tricarboxylate transporter TctB family protein [Alphaproteobacteria bacterium]
MNNVLKALLTRERNPADFVFSVVFVLFSLFLASQIPAQTTWFANKRFFAQPAFWSMFGIGMMVFFGFIHLYASIISQRQAGRWQEVTLWCQSLEYCAWFLGYVILVPIVGYLPMTIIMMFVLLWRIGVRDKKTILICLFTSVMIVVIFKSFLQIKVPGAMLYETFPPAIRNFFITYF